MSATSAAADIDGGPGNLLRELERRQDDVLAQLDQLNAEVEAVLGKLGIQVDAEAPLQDEPEVA